jgi:hypothetical protein
MIKHIDKMQMLISTCFYIFFLFFSHIYFLRSIIELYQDILRSKLKCARIIEARAISIHEFELLLITLPPEYLIH